jgi:hypothetical protein
VDVFLNISFRVAFFLMNSFFKLIVPNTSQFLGEGGRQLGQLQHLVAAPGHREGGQGLHRETGGLGCLLECSTGSFQPSSKSSC